MKPGVGLKEMEVLKLSIVTVCEHEPPVRAVLGPAEQASVQVVLTLLYVLNINIKTIGTSKEN